MKFMIRRASIDSRDEREVSPCEGAQFIKYLRDDIRGTNDPATIRMPDSDSPTWWTDNGVNHRIDDKDRIVRSFTAYAWFIDIDTLEDLIAFMDAHEAAVVLERPIDARHLTLLTIADEHIEYF